MKNSHSVSSGAGIFPARAWNQLARSLNLSERELQIVRHTFDGLTESSIGASLGISPHTVHTHIERLHRKLRVLDRVGLVLRVTEEFLRLTAQSGTRLMPVCAHLAAGSCPVYSQPAAPAGPGRPLPG